MIALVAALAVTVTGTAQQGQKLTATADAGATFQWYRCAPDASHCSSIHGAKAATYTLGSRDVGHVVAVNAGASYAAVGPVAAATAKLAATVQPKISGTTVAGQTLTVDNGTWTSKAKGYTYAWLRCNANGRVCVAIASATTATYVSSADDVGHALVVRVTASNGTVAQPTLSSSTAAVTAPAGPVATAAPSVMQQGQRLVAAPGTWTGSGTVAYAYQWYRCDMLVSHCSSIHGATAIGYTLVAADTGKTIALTLKATDTAATVTVYLSAIGPIGQTATVQPKLTVTPTTLTAPPGGSYTWLRCNVNGRLCSVIAGATQQSYTLTADDKGHSLVATVDGVLSTRS